MLYRKKRYTGGEVDILGEVGTIVRIDIRDEMDK